MTDERVTALTETAYRLFPQDSHETPIYERATPYSNNRLPTVSLHEYAVRIVKYCNPTCHEIDIACRILAHLASAASLDFRGAYRAIIAAIYVALKWTYDERHARKHSLLYMSRVGGIPSSELAALERQVLADIDWSLLPIDDAVVTL